MELQIFNNISLFKSLHITISGAFVVIAIWLIVRSVTGMIHRHTYTLLDRYLSYSFILLLYLQLIFGLIIFAKPVSADAYSPGAEGAIRLVSKRFWPIEHIVLMLFALFIANIGLIFSNQTTDSREKHRKILVYYSIAVVMITVSLIAVNLP